MCVVETLCEYILINLEEDVSTRMNTRKEYFVDSKTKNWIKLGISQVQLVLNYYDYNTNLAIVFVIYIFGGNVGITILKLKYLNML